MLEELGWLEVLILSLGLLPFLIILIWETLKDLSFPYSLWQKAVITVIITFYGWLALVYFFLEPMLYMFGFTALILVLTLLVVIMLTFIIMLRRRIRRIM